MKENKIYKAAIYVRLSKEDGDVSDVSKAESNSISNQKELIKEFLKDKQDIVVVSERVDDGYSGVNFDRPEFQEMITECRTGNIKCIIVKDLSRLGRNYVEVGNLLEQLFPFLGVRVISVNDSYDSDTLIGQTGGIDVVFKNLVYNLYSRDLSQKVKSAVITRMKRGEYIDPFGLFGYKKSDNDIHKLAIDEEAAAIVRRIFFMVIDNMPRREIVKILNEESVPTPAVYKQRKGCTRDWFPEGKKSGWNTSMIAKIIRDERYAGHMVSHKKEYEAFESKHQVAVDKSEWIIIRNTHEGIVSHDDILIILGDAGINFSGAGYDQLKKELLESLPITIFAIHGNHEQRPYTIDTYKKNSGMVEWYIMKKNFQAFRLQRMERYLI